MACVIYAFVSKVRKSNKIRKVRCRENVLALVRSGVMEVTGHVHSCELYVIQGMFFASFNRNFKENF